MPLTCRVLMKKEKRKSTGTEPGLLPHSADGATGGFGGGVGSPVQTWGLLTARGCGGQEDYAIHLSLKESIAFPPTHVRPR